MPLTDLLGEHGKPSRKPLEWTPECDAAFNAIKEQLAHATMLAYPDTNSLMVDASGRAEGGVVQQLKDNAWQPIAFFLRKLLPAETRYSTFGKLLAVYLTIKHIWYMLDGCPFCVFTDHKPLIHLFHARLDLHIPWEVGHLDNISQFTTDLCHVCKRHWHCFCRCSIATWTKFTALHTDTQVDYGAISQAQQADTELQALLSTDQPTSLVLRKVPLISTYYWFQLVQRSS